MALRFLSTLALALATVLASSTAEKVAPSYSVKGSVFCVDCAPTYDYAGIRVLVACDQMKKPLSMTITTKRDGSFESKLPPNHGSLASCQAGLLGGPKQLYALQKNMVSNLVKAGTSQANTYTTSPTLKFASACSTLMKSGRCGAQLGSSKTVDLPVPPEYGLPPTSYYLPVLPIIGIP